MKKNETQTAAYHEKKLTKQEIASKLAEILSLSGQPYIGAVLESPIEVKIAVWLYIDRVQQENPSDTAFYERYFRPLTYPILSRYERIIRNEQPQNLEDFRQDVELQIWEKHLDYHPAQKKGVVTGNVFIEYQIRTVLQNYRRKVKKLSRETSYEAYLETAAAEIADPEWEETDIVERLQNAEILAEYFHYLDLFPHNHAYVLKKTREKVKEKPYANSFT